MELGAEIKALGRGRELGFTVLPREWVEERLATVQEVLERRTERSALILRKLLGTIRMEAVKPDVGRPYYRARTNLDVLAILEDAEAESKDSDPGSNSLHWWRRRESNPRPNARLRGILHACPLL